MQNLITLEYLEDNLTEYHSRGWKAICPDCGGKNLYYTEDNGFCFCFNCDARYRLSDYTPQDKPEEKKDIPAIRSYYARLLETYRDNIPDGCRQYLNNRGINDDLIDQFKIGYCPSTAFKLYKEPIALDAGVTNRAGLPTLSSRVILPYVVDDDIVDMRGRSTAADQSPKYKSLPGSSVARGSEYPYNWTRAYERAIEKKYIIITEGEIKALFADAYGFPCVALPGMISWKNGFIPLSDWRVIVIFDSMLDREARLQTDRAIASIAKRFNGQTHIVSLPLLGENKQDIDSYLLHPRGGPERFEYLVDNAVPHKEYKRLRGF